MDPAVRLLDLLNQAFPAQGEACVFSLREGRMEASLGGLRLQSHFRPFVSARDGQAIGAEGLLQISNPLGEQVSVALFFNQFATGEAMARVDRICRSLHLANHILSAQPGYLFVSLHPRHLPSVGRGSYGETFAGIANAAGLAPARIVFQVLACGAQDEQLLARAAAQFKSHGFLLALDDFGHDHGEHTVSRLFDLKPHVVMFNRDLLRLERAYTLSRLVRAARALGALSGVKNVHTAAERQRAASAGVSILQGQALGVAQ